MRCKPVMLKAIVLTAAILISAVSESKTCKRCHEVIPNKTTFSRSEMTTIIGKACHRMKTRLTPDQWKAMYRLSYKESSWRSTLKNRRSSAYGLYQFLNQTWKDVGISRTHCPYCQSEAAILYIRDRYKTPTRALQFHNSRGWY